MTWFFFVSLVCFILFLIWIISQGRHKDGQHNRRRSRRRQLSGDWPRVVQPAHQRIGRDPHQIRRRRQRQPQVSPLSTPFFLFFLNFFCPFIHFHEKKITRSHFFGFGFCFPRFCKKDSRRLCSRPVERHPRHSHTGRGRIRPRRTRSNRQRHVTLLRPETNEKESGEWAKRSRFSTPPVVAFANQWKAASI